MPKMLNLASFSQTEATPQTVLPDRPVLIGQKLVENAKIENLKCDILGDFQNTVLEYLKTVHALSNVRQNQSESSH